MFGLGTFHRDFIMYLYNFRFDSPENKKVTKDLICEIHNDTPSIKEEEVQCTACSHFSIPYFTVTYVAIPDILHIQCTLTFH